MFSGAAVTALDQIGHPDDNGILNHADAPRILEQPVRLLLYHLFQIMPVLVEFDRLGNAA